MLPCPGECRISDKSPIDTEVRFYPRLPSAGSEAGLWSSTSPADATRLEPATCTEAEPFALRVLDDTMLPEFKPGCIIVIDPTGRATDGSYVLARPLQPGTNPGSEVQSEGEFIFRQLVKAAGGQWQLHAINLESSAPVLAITLDNIVGVVVQRAGTRRSYHKRYD